MGRKRGWGGVAKERSEEGLRSYPTLKTDCSAFSRESFACHVFFSSFLSSLVSSPVRPSRDAPFFRREKNREQNQLTDKPFF